MDTDIVKFFIKELTFEQALANFLNTSYGWDVGLHVMRHNEDNSEEL